MFAYNYEDKTGFITIPHPEKQLCVASVQTFLDQYLKEFGGEVDYIHGDEVVDELGSKPGNLASSCPPWARSSCSRPSWPTACYPARLSPWVTLRTSVHFGGP